MIISDFFCIPSWNSYIYFATKYSPYTFQPKVIRYIKLCTHFGADLYYFFGNHIIFYTVLYDGCFTLKQGRINPYSENSRSDVCYV